MPRRMPGHRFILSILFHSAAARGLFLTLRFGTGLADLGPAGQLVQLRREGRQFIGNGDLLGTEGGITRISVPACARLRPKILE